MREIKFRVWDTFHKQWITETAIESDGKIIDTCSAIPETNCIAQQYIGLKDKNNKEIYEGDIVKFSYKTYENEKEDVIGEVFFDEGIFYFDRKLIFATNDSNFMKESIEVIGNIFEVPEPISKCNE